MWLPQSLCATFWLMIFSSYHLQTISRTVKPKEFATESCQSSHIRYGLFIQGLDTAWYTTMCIMLGRFICLFKHNNKASVLDWTGTREVIISDNFYTLILMTFSEAGMDIIMVAVGADNDRLLWPLVREVKTIHSSIGQRYSPKILIETSLQSSVKVVKPKMRICTQSTTMYTHGK